MTTVRTGGSVSTERLSLGRGGIARARVGFDSDVVRRVELTLVNAAHRFHCGRRTFLSCRGISTSDARPFTFRVRVRR
jgi:hypothetical protein